MNGRGVVTERPLIVSFSTELLAFVVHALREHQKLYTRNGMQVPAGVADVVAALTSGATVGQSVPPLEADGDSREIGPVSPRLVTYATAAQMLACSHRTVKRLVAAGALNTVRVGGLSRLRVADIDAYIADLPAGDHTDQGAA